MYICTSNKAKHKNTNTMTFQQLTEKIGKNKLSQKKEKKMLSELIRQRFDDPLTNQTELQNLILLAKMLKLKCFDQMMQDYDHYEYTNFKITQNV